MKRSSKLVATIFTAVALMVAMVMTPAMAQAALKGKVALVSDVGGRGDLSFNDMGFKGTDKAAIDFGVQMVEIQSATASDYLPNVRNAARSRSFDLIIAVGFLLTDAVKTVAAEHPNQKFMIIDSVVDAPNVRQWIAYTSDETGRAERRGGIVYTIKDGIVYDAKQLLADVARMVEEQKRERMTSRP